MKKILSKDNNDNLINYLINKDNNSNINKKFNSLNYRINSANSKKIKPNIKYFYFTQNKNNRNNKSPMSKNQISSIKPISYQKLFNLNDDTSSNKYNTKNNYTKLMSLINFKNIFNNKMKYNNYYSIFNSPRKIPKNFLIKKGKNLSLTLINNRNDEEDIYNQITSKYNKNNGCKNLTKSHSQNNFFFKNNKTSPKTNDKFNNKKIVSNFKSILISGKRRTFSNSCDASTNTFDIFNNKRLNKNSKIYKRPLMIDYFYSEHKKFCYGFDKLRGKNKYKKPYFIVHKY